MTEPIRPAYGADPDDPRWRYRCTFQHADDVEPPQLPGEVAFMTVHIDRRNADAEIASARQRDDIGRILLEQRHGSDVAGQSTGDEWRTEHTWTRTPNGWQHS